MSELAKLRDRLSETFDTANVETNMYARDGQDQAPNVEHTGQPHRPSRIIDSAVMLLAGSAMALLVSIFLSIESTVYLALALTGLCGALTLYGKFGSRKTRDASVDDDSGAVRERQLHNAKLMADIHEAMGDIVVTRDMDRRIIEANAAFREMTGCAQPQGRTCEEIGIAFRPGIKVHNYDVEIATPYGQRIFTWHDVVSRDLASSRLVIRSIARDVTDERLALITREEAKVRAENANAAKGRLLATVSHEIRLPLSGILGMNHLLSQTRLNDEQRNYLDGMRQSGQSLVQLVEDLLDFSTMEAGRFKLNPRAENLRQLIESIVEMLAHRAHEKGIEIASVVMPDVPDFLDFDPARLRQVLFNLIGNAVKFTTRGGVLVRASMRDNALLITVEDTGPGMSTAEQARIFGEFEQAGSSVQQSAGTGLGLAISARIVREFGGSLTVSSQKGEGSIFSLTFKPASSGPVQYGQVDRSGALQRSVVLLLAPKSVAAQATATSIEALGGSCITASTLDEMLAMRESEAEFSQLTDIIVDHRVAGEFREALEAWPQTDGRHIRKILLVNPEDRASQPQDAFDAWLIRPLREKSLTDVLCGRMRGVERRDAINDNHPGFGYSTVLDETSQALDVLVAEDDPVNARIIRAVLEKSGCKVRLVDDFTSLSQAIGDDPEHFPDVVISDLNMPGGEGLDILPGICAFLDGKKKVPVIVLSADTTAETRSALLDGGVRLVLAKPVDPKRLIEEIHRLSQQKRTSKY
jgi:signal transduction histidine kinase/CheY-like chemotaxis protein